MMRNVFSFCRHNRCPSVLLSYRGQVVQEKKLFSKFSGFLNRGKINDRTPFAGNLRKLSQISKSSRGGSSDGIKHEFSRLVRPFGFMTIACASSFAGAAIWQYESLRSRAKNVLKNTNGQNRKSSAFRQHVNAWWNHFTDGQKVVLGIIGLNVAVFTMWKIPALQPIMVKFFCSNPAIGAPCWSMLLSTFSHYSFIHLALNMYVLWSFSNVAVNLFGKEQFVAMYLSGGLVSSFSSYFIKILRGSLQPSLGASGAILCVLAAVCQSYPDSRLSIAFIGSLFPHSFSAEMGLNSILTFDSLGVLFNWHFFDHAAHLGGALFGMWYAKYGHKLLWKKREPVVKLWHEIRTVRPYPPK